MFSENYKIHTYNWATSWSHHKLVFVENKKSVAFAVGTPTTHVVTVIVDGNSSSLASNGLNVLPRNRGSNTLYWGPVGVVVIFLRNKVGAIYEV